MIKLKNIFKNEDGFTTLGVVVSLLVTLSLVFSTAQIYRINSASSDIQNVSDSCSLAAENIVSEYMILVRVADSVVLSLSLGAITTAGLGVVAMCTPVTAAASDALLEISQKMLNARDNFANKSSETLNAMQKSLPFLASVKAYQVAKANNGGTFNANYLSIALLFPGEGVNIEPGNVNAAKDVLSEINSNSQDIKQAAAQAEEAAKAANEAKTKAFMADCGNNPNYCMYERAKTKANMDGANNPLFKSQDAWSFSVALKRCQAYYPKRIEIEKPEGTSIDAKVNSALRLVFYKYAAEEMKNAQVVETEDVFSANFPHLPKNTEEMKQTRMYTEEKFPVSGDNCIHAFAACPACNFISSQGTLQQLDSGKFEICPYCKFTSSSLGKVAAASSSIDNGYEYHYKIVEQAAKDYQKAREEAEPLNKKVKNFADGMFSKIKDAIKKICNKRIYAKPPGAFGVICLTVNTASAPASKGFESSFVSDYSVLGVRAAVSAATIIEEKSDEGKNVLNSILDGLTKDMPTIAGTIGIGLNAWSWLLKVYSEGQESFMQSIETSLNQLPLFSASGLGTWAAKRLSNFLKDLGLEPARLNALKAVLINSNYVAYKMQDENPQSSSGEFSKTFASQFIVVKDKATKISSSTNSLLGSISNGAELACALGLQDVLYNGGVIELATIKPIGDLGPNIPITIRLPQFATSTMQSIVSWIAGTLQSVLGNIWGGKVWR